MFYEFPLLLCTPPPSCPVGEPAGSQIQQVIDGILNKPYEAWHSFSIDKSRGTVVVPKDVDIRFYDCIFDSFHAIEGNNNFYFERCTFLTPPDFRRGTVLVKDTVFDQGGYFTRSVVELASGNVCRDTIVLYDSTTLHSYNTEYDGEKVSAVMNTGYVSGSKHEYNLDNKLSKFFVVALNNSNYTGRHDAFSNVNFSIVFGRSSSAITFNTPAFNVCLPTDLLSSLAFNGRTWKTPTLSVTDLDIPNLVKAIAACTTPVIDSLTLTLPSVSLSNILSRLGLPTCLNIPAMVARLDCKSMFKMVEGKNVMTIDTMFSLTGASSLFNEIGNVYFAGKTLVDLKNGSFAKLRNIIHITALKKIGELTDNCNFELSKIQKLASALTGFNVVNKSKIKLDDVKEMTFEAGKGFTLTKNSELFIDRTDKLTARDTIIEANQSKVTVKSIKNLTSTLGSIIKLFNKSSGVIKK